MKTISFFTNPKEELAEIRREIENVTRIIESYKYPSDRHYWQNQKARLQRIANAISRSTSV